MPAPSIPETIVRDRPEAREDARPPTRICTGGRASPRAFILLLAATASICMLILNVFWRESYEGDEGFYGVTAQNMLQSPAYLLRPSSFPAGDFAAGKDAFAHPPFNSYLYALALWL